MGIISAVALEIARTSVHQKVLDDIDWFPDLNEGKYHGMVEKQGAFATLYNSDSTLRGCIGVPHPNYSLAHSIAISARNSATIDPRFPKLSANDLNNIYIEVEALSPIQQIQFSNLDDLISQVDVGKHGLIVKYQSSSGLLLPKVGKRYNWGPMELIEHTCQKAGLPKNAYNFDNIQFFNFTSELFSERAN